MIKIKENRNIFELPLYFSCIIFTFTIVLYLSIIGFVSEYEFLNALYNRGEMLEGQLLLNEIGAYLGLSVYAALALVLIAERSLRYAITKQRAIRVSENNFPEIYHIANSISKELEMKKMPEIYIVNRKGRVKSTSSKSLFRSYITISYEIVEPLYDSTESDLIYFALSKELSSIALAHKGIINLLLTSIALFIPLLGPSYLRAKEYSSDRAASLLMGSNGSEVSSLILGSKLYKVLNIRSFEREKKRDLIFRGIKNIIMPRPSVMERIAALSSFKNERDDDYIF